MSDGRKKAARPAKSEARPESVEEQGAQGPVDFGLAAVMESNGKLFDALMKANEAVLRGLTTLNQEVMAFGSTRLRENVERTSCLSACASAEEAFQVNSEFLQSATREYLDEAGKLLQLTEEMNRECWAPIEDHTRGVLQALNQQGKQEETS